MGNEKNAPIEIVSQVIKSTVNSQAFNLWNEALCRGEISRRNKD